MRSIIISVLRRSQSNTRLCQNLKTVHTTAFLKHRDKDLDITSFCEVQEKIMPVFIGKSDRFGGITVLSNEETCDLTEFSPKLEESLKLWKESSKRAIWFKIDLKHSEWVPILAKNGFVYHHAHKDFVMMYKWLPEETCNLPAYAHTMIGVGALVINDKSQVLVVKEKYFLTRTWKLPGGYVEPGENFVDAAIREVLEETSIKTEFVSLLALRHAHGGQFGCSDLYIVVHLKPLTTEIQMDEREISECKWMDIPEYEAHPEVHQLNRLFVKKYLDMKRDNLIIDCAHGFHELLKKAYTIYTPSKM